MRNRSFVSLVATLAFAQVLFAQNNQQASAKKTPAAKAQPFDPRNISGIWKSPDIGWFPALIGPDRPRMTDWGRAKWSQTKSSARRTPLSFGFFPNQKDWNDPLFQCDPSGYPRNLDYGNFHFVQIPNEVLEFFERDHTWRDLWTDGRKLPTDPEPRWYGYSTAHWEGDTFVVNSAGFDDRTWLDPYGSIHSDQMQLEERYRRPDHDTLELVITLTDPKAYTTPWVGDTKVMKLMNTSDKLQEGLWGQRPDGTEYGDIREDYCVYSQERAYWTVADPTGSGTHFNNLSGLDGK